jgi:hypothetical protein
MSDMQVIIPVTLSPSDVTTNVSITETEWTAGTYNTGVERYKGTTLYRVIASPSTSDDPTVGVLADPPTWESLGAINQWAMFDGVVGTQTSRATPIDVTINTTSVTNAIALLNISAQELLITVTDSVDGEVYRKEMELADIGVPDWWEYFFLPYDYIQDISFTDLPSYNNVDINVVLTLTGGTAKCGELIVGLARNIGTTQYGTTVGLLDYSKKTSDDFGNFIVQERSFSKRVDFDVIVETTDVSMLQKLFAQYRSTPLLWIGDSTIEATIIYGFYRNFAVVLSNPSLSALNITVEGLI